MGAQQSGTTTTTQKSAPWDAQQPYLEYGFQQARQNYNSNSPQYFPTSTVAGFTPAQQQSMGMITQRAIDGSPVMDAAKSQLTGTLNGDYLNSNPYLDGMYNSAADSVVRNYQNAVQPGVASGFEAAGRLGSGLEQNAQSQAQQNLGKTLGNMASEIYGSNFQNERQRQMQGMLFAPQMANQDYYDASMLGSVGSAQQAQNQAGLTDQVNRWNFNQNLPNQKLNQYMGLVNGNYGQDITSQTPYYTNPLGELMGTGMGVAGMGNMMGLWGGKAGLGVLGGLFG